MEIIIKRLNPEDIRLRTKNKGSSNTTTANILKYTFSIKALTLKDSIFLSKIKSVNVANIKADIKTTVMKYGGNPKVNKKYATGKLSNNIVL